MILQLVITVPQFLLLLLRISSVLVIGAHHFCVTIATQMMLEVKRSADTFKNVNNRKLKMLCLVLVFTRTIKRLLVLK